MELVRKWFLETQGLKLLHFQKSAPAGSGAGSAGQPTIEGLFEIPELVMSAAVSKVDVAMNRRELPRFDEYVAELSLVLGLIERRVGAKEAALVAAFVGPRNVYALASEGLFG
jgi:hypothetical protein